VHAQTYLADESPLHIVDVAVDGRVLSDRPFSLGVRYQNVGPIRVALTSVTVAWAAASTSCSPA
jgi:hypothetical protein